MAIFLPCIFPQCEDSQSLDTKLKLMSDIKLEMEALMGEIKTKIHNTIHQQHTILSTIIVSVRQTRGRIRVLGKMLPFWVMVLRKIRNFKWIWWEILALGKKWKQSTV